MAMVTKPKPEQTLPARRQDGYPSMSVDEVEGEKQNYLDLPANKAFYSVGSVRAPTARIVREWAKEEGISFKILDFGKDTQQAWAQVRAWKGDEANPTASADGGVVHVFSHFLVEATFDAIANGVKIPGAPYKDNWGKTRFGMKDYFLTEKDWIIDEETHWPKITNVTVQFQLLRNYLAKLKVAERDAITKAERNAEIKLLTKLGRIQPEEPEEVIPEQQEQPSPRPPSPVSSPPTPPSPAESTETRQPESLDEARTLIREGILTLTGGDRVKAQEELFQISGKVTGHPQVKNLASIESLEHANEILSRVRQALLTKNQ